MGSFIGSASTEEVAELAANLFNVCSILDRLMTARGKDKAALKAELLETANALRERYASLWEVMANGHGASSADGR